MGITEILAQTGGIQSIARELGIAEPEATRGVEALAPAILGGFKKQLGGQTGSLAGLGSLIARFGGGSLLDNVLGSQPTDMSQGNDILAQIFGFQRREPRRRAKCRQPDRPGHRTAEKDVAAGDHDDRRLHGEAAWRGCGRTACGGQRRRSARRCGTSSSRQPRRVGERIGSRHRRPELDARSGRRRESPGRHPANPREMIEGAAGAPSVFRRIQTVARYRGAPVSCA